MLAARGAVEGRAGREAAKARGAAAMVGWAGVGVGGREGAAVGGGTCAPSCGGGRGKVGMAAPQAAGVLQEGACGDGMAATGHG